ncbi:MAG TPA: guanylate cyclase [Chloroflexi bacterium]|nr:guanylate cyclase [Chloroflexota bacterium]
MRSRLWQKPIGLIARIAAEPGDSDEVRLQKALLVGAAAFMFIPAGVFWGLLYIALHHERAGAIPLGYSMVSALSVVLLVLTRRYRLFRFTQLLLILLLPWLLMVALGGFLNSSAVVLWSAICPLGALLFDSLRSAARWFLGFLALVVLSGFLQPYMPAAPLLSPAQLIFFFVLNIGGVMGIVFILLYHFVDQKNLFQEKSETLLLNILPKEIAEILKNESRTIADYYGAASILFADVVDFTPMSAEMAAADVVGLLDEVFSHFDSLVENACLEKIKTIGDCYMVAAGVPRPRPDHAHALAHLALEMQACVRDHQFRGRHLTFRIGINSGPVVAGVIGHTRFIYDLWGDAVNTASRMESHGVGGTIQITRATYELIKDDFLCVPRGTVNIKGKGPMEVWHIIGT